MRRFIVERTDGKTDHILADCYKPLDGLIYFMVHKVISEECGAGLEKEFHMDNKEYSYVPSNIVRIVDLGEVKEDEESKDPERHKNDNEDLISRSKLLNFLRNHWSSNVIEVIESFEKAEFLD